MFGFNTVNEAHSLSPEAVAGPPAVGAAGGGPSLCGTQALISGPKAPPAEEAAGHDQRHNPRFTPNPDTTATTR